MATSPGQPSRRAKDAPGGAALLDSGVRRNDREIPGRVLPKRLNLSVQYACPRAGLPERAQIRAWVRAALDLGGARGGQITVRLVDSDEGQALNRDYRGKDYATNVLSFPYDVEPVVCGDLVICAPVVEREAAEQGKTMTAHYAHMVVHGVLHLRGFDHETGKKAARLMEGHERTILALLGYPDPYPEDEQ